MTEITTLQGKTIFQTLELNSDRDFYKENLGNASQVRTSLTSEKIDAQAKQDAELETTLTKMQKWLAIAIAAITFIAIVSTENEEQHVES